MLMRVMTKFLVFIVVLVVEPRSGFEVLAGLIPQSRSMMRACQHYRLLPWLPVPSSSVMTGAPQMQRPSLSLLRAR